MMYNLGGFPNLEFAIYIYFIGVGSDSLMLQVGGGFGNMQHTKGQESKKMHHKAAPPITKKNLPNIFDVIGRGFIT